MPVSEAPRQHQTAALPTTTVSLTTVVFLSPFKEKSHLTFWEKSRPSYTEPWFWYCHKGLCLQPNTNWDALWKQPCCFYFLPSVFSGLHAEGFWHWFHNTAQMFYESPLVCGLHAEKQHSRKLSELKPTKGNEIPSTDCSRLGSHPLRINRWM